MDNIIIHHNDPDGFLSAFWVSHFLKKEYQFFCFDYNYKELPYIKNDSQVFIVDFSLKKEDMYKLFSITNNVHWIDHHVSNTDRYGALKIAGFRHHKYAACVLTYLYMKYHFDEYVDMKDGEPEHFEDVPYFTQLIGDYDAWRYDLGEDTLPFYNGIQLENMSPGDKKNIWMKLNGLRSFWERKDIISNGKIVIKYREQFAKSYCDNYGFFVSLPNIKHKIFAVNIARPSSLFFNDAPEADIYAGYVKIKDEWYISLYSTTVDVSVVAKKFGGGGHKGASGMIVQDFPFC